MEAASGRNSIGPTCILRWIDNFLLQRMMSSMETAPQGIVIAIHLETFDFETVSLRDLRAAAYAKGSMAKQLLIRKDSEILAL